MILILMKNDELMDPITSLLYTLLSGCLASPLHIDDLHVKLANIAIQDICLFSRQLLSWLDWLGYQRSSCAPCIERLKSTCTSMRQKCGELIAYSDVVAIGTLGFVALPPSDFMRFLKYQETVVCMVNLCQDFWPGLEAHRCITFADTFGALWSIDGASLPKVREEVDTDYNEDRMICGSFEGSVEHHCVKKKLKLQFGAVFDGHGNDDTSSFLAKEFSGVLCDQVKLCGGNIIAAMHSAFVQCNRMDYERFAARQKLDDRAPESGSTAVAAVITTDEVHVAWSGNARYLAMGFNDEIIGSNFLRTHTSSNPNEAARLYLCRGANVALLRGRRHAVPTRGFGDHSVRHDGFLVDPEFDCFPAYKVACVVLLSDGVADYMSDEDIARAIRTGKNARQLVHEALWSCGSCDDATALVLTKLQ